MMTTIDAQNFQKLVFLPPAALLPTEEVTEARLRVLGKKIIKDKCWKSPIIVEKYTHIIMDGHHRREFSLLYGFCIVPCYVLGYDEVRVFSRRANITVSPNEIIRRGMAGELYPPKTTRHEFPDLGVEDCMIPLAALQ